MTKASSSRYQRKYAKTPVAPVVEAPPVAPPPVDNSMEAIEKLGSKYSHLMRPLLFGLLGVLGLVALVGAYNWWSNRRADTSRAALGKAMEIGAANVNPSPTPLPAGAIAPRIPTFPSEQERAQKAYEAFQKAATETSGADQQVAKYMAATNLLVTDRAKGLAELEEVSKTSGEVGAQAKFAVAQAKQADNQLDAAAALYTELLSAKPETLPADTLNFQLAGIYEKQNKKPEAADIYFKIAEAGRKQQTSDGRPVPLTDIARTSATKLQELDAAKFAQLPPEPVIGGGNPFGG